MNHTSRSPWRTTSTMDQRRITILLSSPPSLKDSRATRVLPTKTLTTKAQDAGACSRARHGVVTTRAIESSGWSGGPVVDGSDGIVAGFGHCFLGVLGGCAVYLTAQYAAIEVVVRVGGYAGVVHGVGDVGQPAFVAGFLLRVAA